ncbi:MAG: nickel pincer cofactor biosynthesis protein LarB [Methanobrevibacter ruminantium]|uniref:nickel pincer cofactor biosynthesis protein LarB n=1 Tax=Methanobrevibacter ruminantium TaxID=83816 RepID=UPI0026EDC0B5|nr:nickel pincer cofactor biosynthesis protein LarB [Methanobrevibacter ruminantium]MCI5737667.1 nickel pincer cofactor biosynthesis protein LarB [Methanobrevibacter ruminantium]MDD6048670.1 nickel pincer cofactor biosynthesis protein LarB [Methanobrevibacter ruminantium]
MKEILKSLAEGKISIEECETLLKAESIRQLDDVAQIDTSRKDRTGFPEAILADSKDYDDLLTIIKRFFEKQESDSDSIELKNNIIITRLSRERYGALEKDLDYLFEKGIKFDYNKRAKILIIYKDSLVDFNSEYGKVGLLTAGTSDIPIAEEAKVIVEQGGCEVISSYDIGVAGIHRLFPQIAHMVEQDVCAFIVCAGMEGALPSVVAGLVDVPVIAVPTSVGYGIGADGKAALYSMLQSCAPGLSVVNIDNGFGAGVCALTIAKNIAKKVRMSKE